MRRKVLVRVTSAREMVLLLCRPPKELRRGVWAARVKPRGGKR